MPGLRALTARATGGGLRDVSWRAVLAAILISSLYGVSDEYHQLFVPGRSFDVLDMLPTRSARWRRERRGGVEYNERRF